MSFVTRFVLGQHVNFCMQAVSVTIGKQLGRAEKGGNKTAAWSTDSGHPRSDAAAFGSLPCSGEALRL